MLNFIFRGGVSNDKFAYLVHVPVAARQLGMDKPTLGTPFVLGTLGRHLADSPGWALLISWGHLADTWRTISSLLDLTLHFKDSKKYLL